MTIQTITDRLWKIRSRLNYIYVEFLHLPRPLTVNVEMDKSTFSLMDVIVLNNFIIQLC